MITVTLGYDVTTVEHISLVKTDTSILVLINGNLINTYDLQSTTHEFDYTLTTQRPDLIPATSCALNATDFQLAMLSNLSYWYNDTNEQLTTLYNLNNKSYTCISKSEYDNATYAMQSNLQIFFQDAVTRGCNGKNVSDTVFAMVNQTLLPVVAKADLYTQCDKEKALVQSENSRCSTDKKTLEDNTSKLWWVLIIAVGLFLVSITGLLKDTVSRFFNRPVNVDTPLPIERMPNQQPQHIQPLQQQSQSQNEFGRLPPRV